MTRVQILLSEEQDRWLEETARRRKESKASLVRRAVDLLFHAEVQEAEPLERLIGHARKTGERYAARDHDRILAASTQGARSAE